MISGLKKLSSKEFLGVRKIGKVLAIGSSSFFNEEDLTAILGPYNDKYANGQAVWVFTYKERPVEFSYNKILSRVQLEVKGHDDKDSLDIGKELRKEIVLAQKAKNPTKFAIGVQKAKWSVIPGWQGMSEGIFDRYANLFNKPKVQDKTHEYKAIVSMRTYGSRGITIHILKGEKIVWEHKSNNPHTLKQDVEKMNHMLKSMHLNLNTIEITHKLNGKVVDVLGESVIEEARRAGNFKKVEMPKRKGLNVGDVHDIGNNQVELILPRNDLEKRKELLRPLIDSGHKIVNAIKNVKVDIMTLDKPKKLNESRLSNDELKTQVHTLKQHMINKGITRADHPDVLGKVHPADRDLVSHGIHKGTNTLGWKDGIKKRKLNEETMTEEEKTLLEYVLNFQQRRARARVMKRNKNKIKMARDRKARRLATTDQLKIRARRMAIQILRRRLAGKIGEDYKSLSVSQKIQIDKRVEAKKGLVKRIAIRLLPRVRKMEVERYRSRLKNKQQGSSQNISSPQTQGHGESK